jgi:hypothetical protein
LNLGIFVSTLSISPVLGISLVITCPEYINSSQAIEFLWGCSTLHFSMLC